MKTQLFRFASLSCVLCLLLSSVLAQNTAFTYQGRLTDGGAAASGTYDFQFKLYSALSGGTALATVNSDDVTVTNGVFTVLLDFGATHFANNAAQFLEICVRLGNQTGAYTTLAPRQPLSATPYALKSLTAQDALQLNGVAASQYVQTGDARLTDDRNPKTGSANYIQNGTAQQATSNFNISGNGTAGGTLSGNLVNATTQYNLNGARVLSTAGGSNLFVGPGAGEENVTGFGNAFVGRYAGLRNQSGQYNTFLGGTAGGFNETGSNNTFVGAKTGRTNTSGQSNTLLGFQADVGVADLTYATAIGADATVNASNAVVLGRNGGQDTVYIPGSLNVLNVLNVSNGLNVSGAFTVNTVSNSIVLGRSAGQDTVRIPGLGSGGFTPLCRNGNLEVSLCSSSLRYKTDLANFSAGMNLVQRLRPLSFTWKNGGPKDLGFGAEEVAQLDPRLVTYNDKGEVEGVKYDRLSVLFVNAFKEQQTLIEQQQQQLAAQQRELAALKQLVCSTQPQAVACQPAAQR